MRPTCAGIELPSTKKEKKTPIKHTYFGNVLFHHGNFEAVA